MDLNSMYQNGMGSFASMNLGRQMVADQQMAGERLKEQQLSNQNASVMNPLNAQFRQGQIAEQSAQLPGVVGDSQVKASAGQTEAATTGAKIAQRLSSLSGQVGVDGMQKMGREGEIALQTSKVLANYPPALHKEVLGKVMQAYGADPNSPLIAGVMKMPDGDVQKSLETLGTGMAMASKEFLTKSALEDKTLASHEKVAQGNNATTIKAAEIHEAGRLGAAKARADAMAHGKMSVDQAIAMLEMAQDRTPEEDQKLVNLKKQQLQARAAGANAVAPTVLGQQTPLQAAAQAAEGSGPTASAPAAANDDVATWAKQAWGSYEPDKYVYRIGPNGQKQRAPKR